MFWGASSPDIVSGTLPAPPCSPGAALVSVGPNWHFCQNSSACWASSPPAGRWRLRPSSSTSGGRCQCPINFPVDARVQADAGPSQGINPAARLQRIETAEALDVPADKHFELAHLARSDHRLKVLPAFRCRCHPWPCLCQSSARYAAPDAAIQFKC